MATAHPHQNSSTTEFAQTCVQDEVSICLPSVFYQVSVHIDN